MPIKERFENLRAAYLENCALEMGEGCGGDPSVGIFPCRYYDEGVNGGCALKDAECETSPRGLNALAADIHQVAVAHGWWDTPPSFPEVIALCHSELSEALEQYRNGEDPQVVNYHFDRCGDVTKDACAGCFGGAPKCGLAKPDGVPIELADAIIRILDFCGYAGIDIDAAIREKHEHNKTRPHRHGGKRI